MMKIASGDIWVWVIIGVFVLLGKAWNKLQEQIDQDTKQTEPKPRPPQPLRPQQPRPAMSRPEPAGSQPPVAKEWRVDGETVRKFFEDLQQGMQPKPAVPPPMAKPKPPLPAPVTPASPVAPPPVKPAPIATSQPSRATKWAAKLRGRENLRQVIVAAEVIGKPKAMEV